MKTRPSRLHTWLQLFRAPNLFTVPGDPLAGFLLANSGFINHTVLYAMLASICFYAAGLLQNDLADEEEDRRERPGRPLPSGAASRSSVRWMIWALNLGGVLLCAVTASQSAVIAGIGVIVAVTLYNRFTKHLPIIGALNMGLCRSLSVMLGALIGPIGTWQLGLFPAVIIGVYIAVVTNLARHETRPSAPVIARLLPSVVVLLGAIGGIKYALTSPAQAPASILFALAALATLWLAVRLFRGKTPLPPLIGAHIRILLILQAAFCYLGDPWGLGWFAAIVLVAAWPVSALVSRRFYAS
ncbi:UbiA family prenyltransferase [Verrucomicrobiota bacterium sgz303538]